MPSRKATALLPLLILMELLPGFVVLVGSSLLDATTWGYALFWALALVAVGGTLVGLAMPPLHLGERSRRVATVGAAAIICGVPALVSAKGMVAFVVTVIMLGVAFWRGLVLTLEGVSHDDAQQRFAYGFGILFLGILWVVARGIVSQPVIWHMLAEAGIGFIVISMVSLVVSRLDPVHERGAGTAVALAVALQIGILLALSLFALQLFAVDLAGALGHAWQPVFDAVGRHLYNLLGYISDPIDRFVALIRPHPKSSGTLQAPPRPGGEFYGKRPKYHHPVHSPLVALVALALVILVIAAIGYGIWRSIPRARRWQPTTRGYRERRQSTLSLRRLWLHALAWLRSLGHRGGQVASTVVYSAARSVGHRARRDDPIRALYARLLRRSSALGLAIPASSTPSEFEQQLSERWPTSSLDIALLTQAYVERRYGEKPVEAEEVRALGSAWIRVRRLMKGPSPLTALLSGTRSEGTETDAATRDRPTRPFPRAARFTNRNDGENTPWKPTGFVLVALSFALPVFVILGFLVILAVASGRIG